MQMNFTELAFQARVAVIAKCIQLNHLEAGLEPPPLSTIASLAELMAERLECSTQAMRTLFIDAADWKVEERKCDIVSLNELNYCYRRHSAAMLYERDKKHAGHIDQNIPLEKRLAELPPVRAYVEARRSLLENER